ncbi:c-type cytochrome domain-containing protein [Flexithrix dorotheae]|uniref:c-type cytochrome domain-containing protein n=1 Tax=Flexithrix dorotheae TaxID=70993 RepID=UPI00036E9F79|nr:c-type cytochrome domain-containing protein [Flexithrix dorotheae]
MEKTRLLTDKNRKLVRLFIGLFALSFITLSILPFLKTWEFPALFLLLGRFHPLILHFPIVLIIAVLAIELLKNFNWFKPLATARMMLLILASISSTITIIAGFLLFASGEYSGNLINNHFWGGLVTGAGILLATLFFYCYQHISNHYQKPYFIALAIGNLSLAYTSHMGGMATHGQDFLTEYIPEIMSSFKQVAQKSPEEMLIYSDMVAPILEAKCLSCHNENKSKGDFLMTSYAQLLAGGKSEKAGLTPGDLEKSELFQRIILPADHDDHMPPPGKTPMSENEIALLKTWISSGAPENTKIGEIEKSSELGLVIQQNMDEIERLNRKLALKKMEKAALKEELQELGEKLNISIDEDPDEEGNLFAISMNFPPAPFTNDQFKQLSPYFDHFSKASLVSSDIDDNGLYYLGKMTNLKKLYLQKTGIDGSGLIHLQNLKSLKVLNLSHTNVDDAQALTLIQFPALEKVYLFDTNNSRNLVDAINKHKPDMQIILEEGPFY